MPTRCVRYRSASPSFPTHAAARDDAIALPVVPGIAAGAVLCGMRGYKAIADWADGLGQKARERFGCRRENGHYVVPGEFVIRDCLVRIEPGALDRALNAWNQARGADDDALAMDGKTPHHRAYGSRTRRFDECNSYRAARAGNPMLVKYRTG
ncbi:MAG: transposase family protein, partial [Methylococcaceae bacterium]|nr:transposase family protein [Methylococcaceae bacterium]